LTSVWIGTDDDREIELDLRYAFVGGAAPIPPSPDVVYVDVGGTLGPGVIDHHQGTPDHCSATRLVVKHPQFVFDHLVPPWRSAARSRAGARDPLVVSAVIATHKSPDLDALLASYLATVLIRTGRLHPLAEELARMADEVDQGVSQAVPAADQPPSLYEIILALSHELKGRVDRKSLDASECDPLMQELGFRLIEDWCAHRTEGGADRSPDGPSNGSRPAWLRLESEFIDGALEGWRTDTARFDKLAESGRVVRLEGIRIPCRDEPEQAMTVAAAAIPQVEECWFNKHFLRSGRGSMSPSALTVIAAPANRIDRNRFIIAVDPRASRGNLAGLGAALELREIEKRKRIGASHERVGPTRFEAFPEICDPWYDGRGHRHTIIDSPRCGSVLDYDEVVEVLRSSFWEPELGDAMIARFDAASHSLRPVFDGAVTRLDELRAKVASARNADGGSEFLLVRCKVHGAWGTGPVERLAELVCGATPTSMRVGPCTYFIGVRGVLVNGGPGSQLERWIHSQVERVVGFIETLRQQERRLVDRDGNGRRTSYRGLLGEHVRAAAEFQSSRSKDLPAELLPFLHELETRLDLKSRTEAVGRLLEHANEDAERRNGARLNRLVFFVALFGILEAAAALWPEWQDLNRACFVGIVVLSVSSFVRWFQRWYLKVPVLGPMLFDDV
jgi:hypothetical protein